MNYDRRLDDKEFRRTQTRRYLDAETGAGEERDLAAYYAANAPDEDEKAVAALLKISAGSGRADFGFLASEDAAREFDRLAGERSTGSGHRRRIGIWSGALLSCALATALVLILRPASGQTEAPSDNMLAETSAGNGRAGAGADELLGYLDGIIAFGDGKVRSASAVPLGNATLLTLELEDETSIEYILTCGSEEGSASLTVLSKQ